MKENQNGFSVPHLLLGLVVVAIIGFAGWRVYEAQKDTNKSLDNASNASEVTKQEKKEEYKIPEGYVVYENKEVGFKFAYPKEFGDLKGLTNKVVPSISNKEAGAALSTDKPNPPFIEGSTNGIALSVLQSPDDIFYTVKYGPTAKYSGDNLVAVEINPADKINKSGSEYKNFNGAKEVVNLIRGIKVYHIQGGDEGVTNTKFAFKIDNQVVIIELPGFSDGTMGCFETQCEPKDMTEYNEFAKNILNSISKI
jgi:hypothetical protein